MFKHKILKKLTLFIILVTFICFNVCIDFSVLFKKDSQNGHFIQLGSEAWGDGELYYYNKYNIKIKYVQNGSSSVGTSYSSQTPKGWYTYSFSEDIGYYGTGNSDTFMQYPPYGTNTIYQGGGTYMCVMYNYQYAGGSWPYNYYYLYAITTEIAGSLIQSNIKATNGTYPDNGKHTDGYWYTKTGPVSRPPVLSSILPTQNAALFPNLKTLERSV